MAWYAYCISEKQAFPELARHVAATIPNCELVLIPNIGHVPHFEAPEIFHRALLKFLNGDAASSAR